MQQRVDKGRSAHGWLGSNKHGGHLIENMNNNFTAELLKPLNSAPGRFLSVTIPMIAHVD